MSFLPTIYGIPGWGLTYPQPVAQPADADAKAAPAAPLDRPYGFIGPTLGPGYSDAEPPSLDLYWRMRRYSAIVLAYAALCGPILAGTRTLEINRADGTPATAAEKPRGLPGSQLAPEDKLKADLERHFTDLWPDILTGLECHNFGYWLQEVEWERTGGLVLPMRFVDFELDEVVGQRVRILHHNRRFAGIAYDGQERSPQYVLHTVCNPHLNRLIGVPRAEFAREPWWRAVQSEKNGDRLERKASGMGMLVEMATGKTFTNELGQEVIPREMAQTIFNALSNNGAATVPMTFWRRDDIKNNPELAKIPAVKVNLHNWGNSGPDIEAQISRLDALDKRVVRAYGVPERAVTEGKYGTKADAGEHADVMLMGVEQAHSEIVRQFNKQTLDTCLVTNKGPDWRGRLFFKPSPLADAEKAFLQGVAQALVTNPGDPVNAMVDRKRLAERTELPVDPDWKPGKTVVAVDGNKPGSKDGKPAKEKAVALAFDPNQPRDPHGRWVRISGKPVRVVFGKVVKAGNKSEIGLHAKVLAKRGSKTSVAQDIQSLFNEAASSTTSQHEVPYSIVEPYQGDMLERAFGRSVVGFAHTIDADHLRKLMKKHLGTETDEGQMPLTIEDLQRLPEIVLRPDTVELQERTGKLGERRVLYTKALDGRIYVLEELHEKRNQLSLVSMYKKPLKKQKSDGV